MKTFEERVKTALRADLCSLDTSTLQVNLGLRCNQQCSHCHLAASPHRTETMEWPTMKAILDVATSIGFALVDLTGGAPEVNPYFADFVEALHKAGCRVQVRTNLTILLGQGMETMPDWLRGNEVQLVASLPCYLEENVCAQRGDGAYKKSIEAIRRLNAVGYGRDDSLTLNLVYNPGGPFLPPEQSSLEADYKRELGTRFGITFNRLLTITNMPLGRFRASLRRANQEQEYLNLLRKSFNPQTLDGLMCRHQISIGWDGSLYDCDFNLALGYIVDHGAPNHIKSYDRELVKQRRIVTGEHCFGCTAGHGSSCGGALV